MQPGQPGALPFYEGYTTTPPVTSTPPVVGTSGANGMPPPPPVRRNGGEIAGGPAPAPPPVKDEEAFARMYVMHEEIGRGAFSVVHRCTNRVTGDDYAVKIIDLRPLQLRESFDQTRLRREVEIMRKLQHPNVICLVEVFETPKTMMLVLEYARGTELFDSILQKQRYSEEEARPIFEQLAHALGYLHSLNIVHRDIKPENVVLLDKRSPEGYLPFAKLLDFGLSKMIGQDDGSAARTFVGTPCYLAPEVEARAYGQGKSYGTKVDCWSLGAVLYVMLVARFPEFDRSQGGMRVKLDSPLWATVSDSAKDLIRSLMQPDPEARYSVQQALCHPWVTGMPFTKPSIPLGAMHYPHHQAPATPFNGGSAEQQWQQQQQLGVPGVANNFVCQPAAGHDGSSTSGGGSAISTPRSQSEEMDVGGGEPPPSTEQQRGGAGVEVFKLSSTGDQIRTNYTVEPGTNIIRSGAAEDVSATEEGEHQIQTFTGEQLNLLPLVNIQHSIAQSIELAHRACLHRPEDADDIKRSAILCRSQLIYTIKLLKKIEQTATSVLDMFPDLELAVEDGEPVLAHSFFNTVKNWVGDLRRTVSEAQHRNHESMIKLHKILVRGEPTTRMAVDVTTPSADEEEQQQHPPHQHPFTPQQQHPQDTGGTMSTTPIVTAVGAGGGGGEVGGAGGSSSAKVGRNGSVEMLDAGSRTSSGGSSTGGGGGERSSTHSRQRVRARDEAYSQGSSWSSSSPHHQSPAHEATGSGAAGEDGQHQQQHLNMEGLDGDLYQVVKKLREAKDNDEAISENQLLDLFFPLNKSGNGHNDQYRGNTGEEKGEMGGSTSTSDWPSLGPHPGQQSPFSQPQPGHPLEHKSSSASSGSSSSASDCVNSTGMGLMRMTDSIDEPATPTTSHHAAAAAGLRSIPEDAEGLQQSGEGGSADASTKSQELSVVLAKLKDVDYILEHLAIFWAQTEVILDLLLQKSDHVERFVEFAHKPRLLTRFRQRMGEYKRFWKDVQTMCKHFTSSVNAQQPGGTAPAYPPPGGLRGGVQPIPAGVKFYAFLEGDGAGRPERMR